MPIGMTDKGIPYYVPHTAQPADARTVLPGQPVTYHPAPRDADGAVYERRDDWRSGGIALGPPIPAQPDPSKIVDVVVGDVCSCGRARGSEVHAAGAVNGHPFEARGEPELPPIPEPGFYWAKLQHDDGSWTVVEVSEYTKLDGRTRRHVEAIGSDGGGCGPVVEWGPKLEPPR